MKVIYINGFMGENSTKPQKLSKLLNEEVEHLKLIFQDGKINEQDLDIFFEKEHKNIKYIISVSIGSYISRYYANKYFLGLISLNPIVELEKTFALLNYKLTLSDKFKDVNTLSVNNLIFLNKDDEVLDYKQTYKTFYKHSKIILFNRGGHKFTNLSDINLKSIEKYFRKKYTFDRWKIKEDMSSWSFKIFKHQNKELIDMYIAHILAQESIDKSKIEKSKHIEYADNFKSIESWKNNFDKFDNWINLNAIIAMSSILEMYMTRVIKLALHSDMELWKKKERDGIKLHKKEKHKSEGTGKATKCTSKEWEKRIKAFQDIFGDSPKIFTDKNILTLEKMRKIRNNIGHSFGVDLDESKKQYDNLIPLDIVKVGHEEIIEYLKLTYQIAQNIDKQLMTKHIGTYQYLKFYHDKKKELSLEDEDTKIQANILKKEIVKFGESSNKASKTDILSKEFYIELIKYYKSL